jgi:hypothetical protein
MVANPELISPLEADVIMKCLRNGDSGKNAQLRAGSGELTAIGTFRELARFLVGVCRKYRATCLRIQTEVP